ncbi:MAG: WYL domain-containing protein, partial [Armatimonadetes bacterium]|nr:WYL domain-containing protein [Armatimonadota bacterium]
EPAAGKLVEIAAIAFDVRGRTVQEFCSLINPGQPIPPDAQLVHGITDEMVAGAPVAEVVVPRIVELLRCKNAVGVAHNAPFDLAFISLALARAGIEPPHCPVLDTRLLAKTLIPGMRSYALQQLADYFGISPAAYHRALPDARTTLEVFLHLLDYITADQFTELPRRIDVFTFADADISPAEPPEGFEALATALEEGRDVIVRYAGGRNALVERRLTPLALFRRGERIYLTALCHRDGVEKNFRIDRIVSLRVAE